MKLYPTQISTEDLMCNSRTSRRTLGCHLVMKTKDSGAKDITNIKPGMAANLTSQETDISKR